MAGRHSLLAVVLFAVSLHAIAITQTILPAQDGLKFIRIARLFHSQPLTDVVRGSDTHPLYPALIAAVEPVVASVAGHGPDAWRLAAQIVAVFGSIGLILPIYGITRALFDRRIACLAAALAVLLPRAAELGHDTLSDSLGLMCTFFALWLGAIALRRGDWRLALASGLAAGLGYLARPEVILVPFAIGLTWLIGRFRDSPARTVPRGPALMVLLLSTMVVIGSYAVVKGEISEKLAIRYGAWLRPKKPASRLVRPTATRGLDNPKWDFSPKEETDRIPIRNWEYAVLRITGKWWEELCWLFAVMTVWGIVRQRYIRGLCADRDPSDGEVERRLMLVFGAVYGLALVRHSALLGYLSGRHIMALVYASVPWAAAGSFVCARGIAVKRCWGPRFARNGGIVGATMLVAASVVVQMQPNHLNHLSRWGHRSAGQWLAGNAKPAEMVLDTRGWARFVSGQPGYDYWHVRTGADRRPFELHHRGVGRAGSQERASEDAAGPPGLLGDSGQGIPRLPRRSNGRRSTLSLSPSRHLGRTGPVSYGSLWQRWFRGVSWTWINEQYRARVPDDLGANVMTLESRDRFHAKQGRSTARVVLVRADRPLTVYLKRHFRLPWRARLAALVDPGGKHSPAAAEWAHLERARALGIDVPEVVAAGEHIGPWAHLRSFVMIAELSGSEAVNELLPRLADQLDSLAFESLKRCVIREMARITATLHSARAFHKDLYLCHFFVSREALRRLACRKEPVIRLSLIDLHRLAEHKLWPDWWRWKDLGQLLFSTFGVAGITDRDRLRFWRIYCRRIGIRRPRWHARMVRLRAARYLEHNRKPR